MKDINDINISKLCHIAECPLCGSPDRTIFENDHNDEDSLCVVRCVSCEFIYMNAVVASDALALSYIGYNTSRDTADSALEAKRKIMYGLDHAYVESFLQKDDLQILDVGCARGDFLARFSDRYHKFGVEIDADAREEGLSRYPNITLYATIDEVPDTMYDAIIFRGTIQYMPDLSEIVTFCTRHLQPEGRLFILATPNADSLLAQIQKEHWVLSNKLEHRYWFSMRHLERLFGNAFVLCGWDFPYLKTSYARYDEDLKKAIALFSGGDALKERFPFFGSMMNMVFERK